MREKNGKRECFRGMRGIGNREETISMKVRRRGERKKRILCRREERKKRNLCQQAGRKKRMFRLLARIGCFTALFLVMKGEYAAFYAGPKLRNYYSDSYHSPEEIPEPAEEYTDESGRTFRLISSEIEEVPVSGRKKRLSGQVIYREVGRDAVLPETAKLEVQDEESGQTFEAELPLEKAIYEKERWKGDFSFGVTFHTYGADSYRFGGVNVPHDAQTPPLEACRAELLEAVGMSEEDCRLESFSWDGEPYTDDAGELCRDARVMGIQKVWDCRAVYSGDWRLPDYKKFRLTAEYEAADPPEEKENVQKKESQEESIPVLPESEDLKPEKKTSPLLKWLHRTVAASVSLLLLTAAVWGFRLLWKMAVVMQQGVDQEKEENKRE